MTKSLHETLCYSVRSQFNERPDLNCCPHCRQELAKQVIEATRNGEAFQDYATIPIIETLFYYCTHCGWWAVRETCVDCEFDDAYSDHLVIAKNPANITKPFKDNLLLDQLWKEVIKNPKYWEKCQNLSLENAVLIFGQEEVSKKSK